jgi:hypothetical protein
MAKAKFTQDQVQEAMAEFFSETVDHQVLAGAGNNGPIVIYKLNEVQNGTNERPSN